MEKKTASSPPLFHLREIDLRRETIGVVRVLRREQRRVDVDVSVECEHALVDGTRLGDEVSLAEGGGVCAVAQADAATANRAGANRARALRNGRARGPPPNNNITLSPPSTFIIPFPPVSV